MAKTKILARGWTIEAGEEDTVTPGTYTWTKVAGINSFTISSDKEDADTTDFDNGGYNSHMVASRSNEITFEGHYIEDNVDGTRDPGQQKVEDYAELIGPESIKPLRLTSPAGKVRQFNGSFTIGDVGGGVNDPTSWGATYTPSGAPVTVAP